MCKRFVDWQQAIQSYCADNGLDFSKAEKTGKCWGEDFLILQHIDLEEGKRGLLDETPAPVVLIVRKHGDSFKFEQTEHTVRYLS